MMQGRDRAARPPVVLVVDDQEWSTRALESVLAPNGYAVMRAYSAAKGFERASAQPPDLVFISGSLADGEGVELCRRLRSHGQFADSIPVVMTSSERPGREERIRALEAGAWDYVSYPIDAQELTLRLDAYVRAKFDADRARERCLMDEPTGLYNLRGLERRGTEMRCQAYRAREPMACVVLGPQVTPLMGADEKRMYADEGSAQSDEAAVMELAERLGRTLQQAGRVSDAIGRLGMSEFVVIAPATDADGAARLAERLAEAVRSANAEDVRHVQLRAGYDAVANMRDTPVEAKDLLLHATMALRKARANGNGSWLLRYEPRDSGGDRG